MDKDSKNKRDNELKDLRKILELPEGRRFMWRLLEVGGLYRSPSTGESLSTHENIGMQKLALWAVDECVEASPEAAANLLINNKLEEN